jgi:SAM-dependent methyltransferase
VPFTERSPSSDIAIEIAKNIGMGIGPVRRWRLGRPRTVPGADVGSDERVERYALQGLRFALLYHGALEGADIAEFGPGDNLASGLAMLAGGARSYTALDRFGVDYSSPQAKRWYRAVEDRWPTFFPHNRWPEWLRADAFPEAYPDRVEASATAVEDAAVRRQFDIVCSYQVAEHVVDVNRFASLTASLLTPDGVAIHRVDFGPHDCWTRYDDPLTFLRFAPWLWSAMGCNRGYPNRVRHHELWRALKQVGLEVDCVDRTFYSAEQVRLERLHSSYREMPVESLLTADTVYVCHRIRSGSSPASRLAGRA